MYATRIHRHRHEYDVGKQTRLLNEIKPSSQIRLVMKCYFQWICLLRAISPLPKFFPGGKRAHKPDFPKPGHTTRLQGPDGSLLLKSPSTQTQCNLPSTEYSVYPTDTITFWRSFQ